MASYNAIFLTVLVVCAFLSPSGLIHASLCHCPWFDKANNIYWREKFWSSHLRDKLVLWTSVLVRVFKNFNCVLKHTHNCCTTGNAVLTFILSLQHFHLTHANCMHIFLVILDWITLMTFREGNKLWSSPLHDFLHPSVISTPTHLPKHAVLKGISF